MSNPASKNAERTVMIFTFGYLGVASYLSWKLSNWEFVFYVVVVLTLALFVKAVHERVKFSSGILWLLSLWGFAHMLGGLVPVPESWPINGDIRVLYSVWLIPNLFKYDHLIRMYGFGVCTWVCWQVLSPIIMGSKDHVSEIVLAVLASNGLGAFNEIIEFAAVLLLPSTNVGGYINTGWDMVANLAGSVIAAFVIWYGRPVQIPKRH